MLAMVRTTGALLLLSAACAKAVAPTKGPAAANATARLEALITDMAKGQEKADAAPVPKPLGEDVVILEGQEQRRMLGVCNCNGGYRNGAGPTTPVCAKSEGGRNVCYPQMSTGRCSDREATRCGGGGGGGRLSASPAPTLFEAEEAEQNTYLNVNMQLYEPHVTQASQLPTPEDFARTLASLLQVSARRVSVVTSWGASASVRSASSMQQPTEAGSHALTPTATVHATVEVRHGGDQRREALGALLAMSEELPEIAGHSYRILNVQAFEQSSRPLVCGPEAEASKSQSANLLRQLVDLKRQEVELMRQAVATASQATSCNANLLQRIAHRLGLTV